MTTDQIWRHKTSISSKKGLCLHLLNEPGLGGGSLQRSQGLIDYCCSPAPCRVHSLGSFGVWRAPGPTSRRKKSLSRCSPSNCKMEGRYTYPEACRHPLETGQMWTASWWAWAKPFSVLCVSPEQLGLLPCGYLES